MFQTILKCGLLLSLAAGPAFSQTNPDTTVAAALRSLSAEAAVVFAGKVVAIRPIGGVVEITFSVDQNLKGQTSGDVVLREWAGLWAAGQRRYWIGENAVVFLHEAGKSGLSSSVDGMEGILPISPDATATLSVDVQRLRTRVVRAAGAPLVDSTEQMSLAQVTSVVNPPPAGEPIVPPVNLPVPVRGPIPFPVSKPIAEPEPLPLPIYRAPASLAPTHLAPILVPSPDTLDDFDIDDEPRTKPTPKTNPTPGAPDATY